MSHRTFYNFIDHRGEDVISDWLRDRKTPKGTKVQLDSRLNVLANVMSLDARPNAAYLAFKNGVDCRGLFEVRLKVKNQHLRIIGYEGPDGQCATLLVCCREKDREFVDPKDPCGIAKKRIADLESGRGDIVEYFRKV